MGQYIVDAEKWNYGSIIYMQFDRKGEGLESLLTSNDLSLTGSNWRTDVISLPITSMMEALSIWCLNWKEKLSKDPVAANCYDVFPLSMAMLDCPRFIKSLSCLWCLALLHCIILLNHNCCLFSRSSQKRAFNGYTGVIGYADSDFDIVNIM